MKFLNEFRRRFRVLAAEWIPALAVAGCVGFCAAGVQAQSQDAWVQRIAVLRGQIKNAEAQHADGAELGGLWLQLANRYQDELQYADAEDAFVRALRLLHAAGSQAQYADALDGMASLDLATGRLSDAQDCDKKALAVYEALGDRNHAGKMHETIALALLFAHRAREAEAESAMGLAELQLAKQPDTREMLAARLTHSYASCYQKRCAVALEDANQAMEVARANFPDESLEVVTVWAARGFAEWKLGLVQESDHSMSEALRLARGLTELPQPVLLGARLGVMRQYEAFLKETHRKAEAAQMEAEAGRLELQQQAGCSGCTVSVAALGFMP